MNAQLNSTEYDKIGLIQAISAVGAANFFIFGLINYRSGDYTSAYFEWGLIGIIALNVWYLRLAQNTQAASSIALLLITAALTYLLITGGIAGTGIFWFYTFPALAFFLKGRHLGWSWFALLIFTIGVVLILNLSGYVPLIYSLTTLRQLVASLLTVAILIYFYQSVIEHNDDLLHQSLTEIQTKNEILEKSAAIAEEKARDDAFLACIGEGVVITDPEYRVIRANTTTEEITGYSLAELQGKRWGIDVPSVMDEDGTIIPIEKHALSKVINGSKKVTDTYYYSRKNGERFPIVITAAPVVFAKEVIGAILVFRDITKEKAADQAKSEFISLASHQLRTPLSEMRWYVEAMQKPDKTHDAAWQKKYLKKVHDANINMITLVNDLLNISSIEMGTFSYTPQQIDTKEITDGVLTELHSQITQKKITVHTKIEPGLKKLTTDRMLFYIMVQNILSNAVKYSKEKGSIELTVKADTADKHTVLLSISDNGYGIPADQREQVFSKLFRGENVRSKITGTGLGLYVVKSIVDFLKGSITFTSEEDHGTTFYIKLPLPNEP